MAQCVFCAIVAGEAPAAVVADWTARLNAVEARADALAAAADHQWRVSARSPQRYEQEVTA